MDKELFTKITERVERKCGISPSSMSVEAWERLIQKRMDACKVNDPTIYLQLLYQSPVELQELIELIIVPETWFFRDPGAFEFLSKYLISFKSIRPKREQIRILSLPCSTGEEPYSIAMTLLSSGMNPSNIHIEGVDVSQKGIIKAKTAIYGKRSFRSKDLAFRDEYFLKVYNRYHLKQAVKNVVKLQQGNVFDPQFDRNKVHYDVIFCRNLLIYLEKQSQANLLKLLDSLLNPNGVLIISPVEIECVRHMGYVPDSMMRSCAFHKSPNTSSLLSGFNPIIPTIKKRSEPEQVKQDVSKTSHSLLEEANRLADEGHFTEAMPLCEAFLEKNNTDPSAFFLKGVIEHAIGNESLAENDFLKTVYLQPNHYEALVYLTLLAEKNGDTRTALLFQNRAQKALNQNQSQS